MIDDPSPEICQELVRVVAVTLADSVGDDRLQVRLDPDEDILVPEFCRIGRRNSLLLFADVAPKLVEFEPIHLDKLHESIVQLGTAVADTDAETHDRVAMNSGQPFGCANRATLGQGGDDGDLLIAGED